MSKPGIEAIHTYVPMYTLALDDLADARSVPRDKFRLGLGVESMAIAPPWEDSVSLAVNAAAPLFDQGLVDREEIGLLLVGTETSVDHSRPVSIWLHQLLDMPEACRTYEIKHACYGGTAALMTAMQWIASGAARGRKALIVATDIARYDLGSAGEPTQGAGAVAMVVSESGTLLELDVAQTGSFARGVFDFWRPLDRSEALVDGKFSVDCYLDALEGAVRDYGQVRGGAGSILDRFRAVLYHTPFPKMAKKAHGRLVAVDASSGDLDEAALVALTQDSYQTLVDPYLAPARSIGNSYTASLYFALAGLLENHGTDLAGEPIALFSYGSGCCAEFFPGTIGKAAAGIDLGLRAALEKQQKISFAEYEAIRLGSQTPTDPPAGFFGRYWFSGTPDDRRSYQIAA